MDWLKRVSYHLWTTYKSSSVRASVLCATLNIVKQMVSWRRVPSEQERRHRLRDQELFALLRAYNKSFIITVHSESQTTQKVFEMSATHCPDSAFHVPGAFPTDTSSSASTRTRSQNNNNNNSEQGANTHASNSNVQNTRNTQSAQDDDFLSFVEPQFRTPIKIIGNRSCTRKEHTRTHHKHAHTPQTRHTDYF